MDFIPASSPKHVPFSLEERAQLDLLRILGKAGVSLQIQDKIINWVCHYSLVNKLRNSGRDFWIRCNFPGREPFLNDLSKKVGTTGHRPQLFRVLSDYDGRTMSVPVYSPVTELLSLLRDPIVMAKKSHSRLQRSHE